jgi:hypothetical protein
MIHELHAPEGSGVETNDAPETGADPMKSLLKTRVCGKSRQSWIRLLEGLPIRTEGQLLQLNTARAKLLDPEGRFGVCEAEGPKSHKITLQRLLANPTATLCIQCQIKAEKLAIPTGGTTRRRTR